MKKLIKLLLILCVLAGVLLVGGILTLKMMFPPEKIKQLAQEYVQKNFNRQVRFEQVSFNWIGLTLRDFALSEESSFEQGTFIKANQLVAKVAVKPLLKKQIQIDTLQLDGLDAQLIARKDGTFNFSSLATSSDKNTPSAQTASQTSQEQSPLVLTAQQISASRCNLTYVDEIKNTTTALQDLNITLQNVDMEKPFTAHIDFTTHLAQPGQENIEMPVSLDIQTVLANFDLPNAYVQINNLTARYKTAQFTLQGKVENLQNPSLDLTGRLTGADYTLLTPFLPDVPPFSIAPLTLKTSAAINLDQQQAQIHQFSLEVQNSFLRANGQAAWGAENPTYQLDTTAQINLKEAVSMAGTGGELEPQGLITAALWATDKKDYQDISGTVSFKNASLVYNPFTLQNLNGTVTLAGLDHISSQSLTGMLNDGNFKGSFSYKSLKNVMDLALNLTLDKLTIKQFPSSAKEQPAQNASAHSATTAQAETYINLTADINVGPIDMPYFRSNGLTLTAAMQNISQNMKKSNGNISFDLQQGAITDLDSFVEGNKIVKIILLPLSIVRKVSATLKLNLFQSEGFEIALAQGKGSYTFTNGVMNVDQTLFDTSVSKISATGSVNFVQDVVAMKATATLLTDALPMVIKITGTPSNPSGKLDVTNTLGSVVGGILTGKSEKSVAKKGESAATNAVRDTVTDTAKAIKQIGGLFKKK